MKISEKSFENLSQLLSVEKVSFKVRFIIKIEEKKSASKLHIHVRFHRAILQCDFAISIIIFCKNEKNVLSNELLFVA
jgi:hypothetical protein